MLSIRVASRFLRARPNPLLRQPFPLVAQQFRSYADLKTVKVPEMAESISEGTLKQWSKQIGDYVEQVSRPSPMSWKIFKLTSCPG